jgi:MFS family permease
LPSSGTRGGDRTTRPHLGDHPGVLRRYLRSFTGFERDARLFLLVTLLAGGALSLYWIDFNLYLASLGLSPAVIGSVATAANAAAMLAAFPTSYLSDRFGRRFVLLGAAVLSVVAFAGLLFATPVAVIALLACLFAVAQSASSVVSMPFLAENSRPNERSELFSLWFAISSATNVVAALLGGLIAQAVSAWAGHPPDSPETYRVLIALMVAFSVAALLVTLRLHDDRPRWRRAMTPGAGPARATIPADDPAWADGPSSADRSPSEDVVTPVRSVVPAAEAATAAGPPVDGSGTRSGGRLRSALGALRVPIVDRGRFVRLLVPGFIISIGAGQVIPFLNLFVEQKFSLDVASLNALFAVSNLGTLVAVLIQPALAHRFGKVGSVVLVQGASIPFLLVLGFSPAFWTVAIAMAVRNSLMNAGNPIANAFAMEHVAPVARATLSAAMSLLWSLGFVIGAAWFSVLQSALGFDAGYAVNFLTITALYTIATWLYWAWFRPVERREMAAAQSAAQAGTSGR